jgi:arylsulfatase
MRKYLLWSVGASLLAVSTSAHAQITRSVLPVPAVPFKGKAAENVNDSTPATAPAVRAPDGAPNIFLFMSDDVGFSMASAFGGPVPTPNMERLARTGQRYNRFNTTALCSPTRAALLTGRNHHNAGTGNLADLPLGFPGYTGEIPASTATIAQTLRLNGYNTAMFGKHHNVVPSARTMAGPFDTWPIGLGFEYFFGFMNGDTDQYHPNLYRGTSLLPTQTGKPVLFERRMADDAITWLRNQRAAAPDKPFFVYYAPGSMHAPHQAPREYIDRFKGKFDQGWDKLREENFQRELAMGVVPQGTRLTPRPADIPAWSTLSTDAKKFAIRSMEVAAGMLAYQDEQLGRVLAELDCRATIRVRKRDNQDENPVCRDRRRA